MTFMLVNADGETVSVHSTRDEAESAFWKLAELNGDYGDGVEIVEKVG